MSGYCIVTPKKNLHLHCFSSRAFPPLALYNLGFPILPSRIDKHQLICINIYSAVPLNFYALKHQIGLF